MKKLNKKDEKTFIQRFITGTDNTFKILLKRTIEDVLIFAEWMEK